MSQNVAKLRITTRRLQNVCNCFKYSKLNAGESEEPGEFSLREGIMCDLPKKNI